MIAMMIIVIDSIAYLVTRRVHAAAAGGCCEPWAMRTLYDHYAIMIQRCISIIQFFMNHGRYAHYMIIMES
jgi:hypothetical protein